VYCVTTSAACLLLISSSNFFVLLLSRVVSGLSMSILASAFESWMIREHMHIGFPSDWITKTVCVAMDSLLSD
jgi:hypothetical protein